jgi:hypothetical protein
MYNSVTLVKKGTSLLVYRSCILLHYAKGYKSVTFV